MSFLAFQKKFRIEKSSHKHLFQLRWPQGYRCPRCQHDQAYFHRTRLLYACKACGYQTSLTAGTIFHKTRTTLRKWFWMIFLMGRQKSGASMFSLQRILEILAYKTVYVMRHKIRKVMAERDAY
ncbi:MAG: IS1595 family transposase [Chloroflexi bacterium]|nr:MAG: IS1595 family transposase [Chloroflexota bacterium]